MMYRQAVSPQIQVCHGVREGERLRPETGFREILQAKMVRHWSEDERTRRGWS